MLRKLKPKSEFIRNIVTLMTGTSIAQAIPIAISPILTRIYTPEDFGIFALYMSIVSIVAVLATGKYELAIMLPKTDEDAFNIVILAILNTIVISIVLLLIVILFNQPIVHLLENKDISNWLYMVPLSVFLMGLYQSLNYWNNRKKNYKTLAINRVLQSGLGATTNVGFGFQGFGSVGLIFSTIFSQSVSTIVLARATYNDDIKKFKYVQKSKIIDMSHKFVNFPKYILPSEFITMFLYQLPNFFLTMFFNITYVGFYNLVQRILGMPMSLLSRSISDVFREQASTDYNKKGSCVEIYTTTFKILFLLGLFPLFILFLYAPDIFSFIFGNPWRVAGEFAQILSIMFFFKFVSSPLSYIFYIVNKQKVDLYFHIYLLVSTTGIFYFTNNLNDIKTTLILYSINYSVIYLIYIFLSYSYSKGNLHVD